MPIESVMPSNHLILCCPISFCPQSFPASRSFPMSQLFASDGQSTGASGSTSFLPMNIQDWFSLELTGLISLLFKGLSGVFSSIAVWRHQFFGFLPSLWSSSQPYVTTGATTSLAICTFVGRVMSLLFYTQSRFVITFLPRSNCLVVSWLQSLLWYNFTDCLFSIGSVSIILIVRIWTPPALCFLPVMKF